MSKSEKNYLRIFKDWNVRIIFCKKKQGRIWLFQCFFRHWLLKAMHAQDFKIKQHSFFFFTQINMNINGKIISSCKQPSLHMHFTTVPIFWMCHNPISLKWPDLYPIFRLICSLTFFRYCAIWKVLLHTIEKELLHRYEVWSNKKQITSFQNFQEF